MNAPALVALALNEDLWASVNAFQAPASTIKVDIAFPPKPAALIASAVLIA